MELWLYVKWVKAWTVRGNECSFEDYGFFGCGAVESSTYVPTFQNVQQITCCHMLEDIFVVISVHLAPFTP
jgi:hypothetical protein